MNSKRIFALLLSGLLLAGSFASCTKKDKDENKEDLPKVEATIDENVFEVPEGIAADKTFSLYLCLTFGTFLPLLLGGFISLLMSSGTSIRCLCRTSITVQRSLLHWISTIAFFRPSRWGSDRPIW